MKTIDKILEKYGLNDVSGIREAIYECCDEQIKACGDSLSSVISESHRESILSTPNVAEKP